MYEYSDPYYYALGAVLFSILIRTMYGCLAKLLKRSVQWLKAKLQP